MSIESQRLAILLLFKQRSIGPGEFFSSSDFCEAYDFHGDPSTSADKQAAFESLKQEGLLCEHNVAIQLTESGAAALADLDIPSVDGQTTDW
jgi:hypothetical protein